MSCGGYDVCDELIKKKKISVVVNKNVCLTNPLRTIVARILMEISEIYCITRKYVGQGTVGSTLGKAP